MKGRSTVMRKGPDRLEGLKVELGRTTERVEVDDRILRRFGTGLVKLANRPYRALAVCERDRGGRRIRFVQLELRLQSIAQSDGEATEGASDINGRPMRFQFDELNAI